MSLRGKSELFTGVKGLITENPDTNFPADACTDLLNVDLGIDGSVTTRKGIQDEEGGSVITATVDQNGNALDCENFQIAKDTARQTFMWESVAGVKGANVEVLRIGLRLYLFLHSEVMSDGLIGAVNLSGTSIITNSTDARTAPFSFSSGNGRLYCANKGVEPFTVEMNTALDSFSVTKVTVQIRDFKGVDEDIADDARPFVLTPEHNYNLFNQGWPRVPVTVVGNRKGSTTGTAFPIDYTQLAIGQYPSNADIYHVAKADSAEEVDAIGSYSPFVLKDLQLGNTPAPKGHFIVDAFSIQRILLGSTFYKNRPTATAFYGGRVWWSGVEEQDYAGTVFFSQSGDDVDKAGKCYQSSDPTSEEINDLVATDGGVIPVQQMNSVLAMHTIGDFLVIFAVNGVWTISGADGGTFSATDVSVKKVSDNGAISPYSIVAVDDAIYYFGKTAIHRIVKDSDVGLTLNEQNLTEATIKSHYLNILASNKIVAQGVGSAREGKVYWAYADEQVVDPFDFNKYLILDTRTGAFTVYKTGDIDTLRVTGLVSNDEYIIGQADDDPLTTNDGTELTLNDGNTLLFVEGGREVQDIELPKIKVATLVNRGNTAPHGIMFAEFASLTYYDWFDRTPAVYEHYFTLGFNAMTSNATKGTPVYVNSFFARDPGIIGDETGQEIGDGGETMSDYEKAQMCLNGVTEVIGLPLNRGYAANTLTTAKYTMEQAAYSNYWNPDATEYREYKIVMRPDPDDTQASDRIPYYLSYMFFSIDCAWPEYKLWYGSSNSDDGDGGEVNDLGYISLRRMSPNRYQVVLQGEEGFIGGDDDLTLNGLQEASHGFYLYPGKYYYLQVEIDAYSWFINLYEIEQNAEGDRRAVIMSWDVSPAHFFEATVGFRPPTIRSNYIGFNTPGLNVNEVYISTNSDSALWNNNPSYLDIERQNRVYQDDGDTQNYITFSDNHDEDHWVGWSSWTDDPTP
ncbi:hypothetical protein NVP1015O_17 [Vibrio phage 1.015.O._10N.222.51.E5]|nr:hypothetical protein NVP1015O_17 [Vibrio phage 1.015.O._10N.222.51.E5]